MRFTKSITCLALCAAMPLWIATPGQGETSQGQSKDPHGTNGLYGTISIPSPIQGIMDTSYHLSASASDSDKDAALAASYDKVGKKLGELDSNLNTLAPPMMTLASSLKEFSPEKQKQDQSQILDQAKRLIREVNGLFSDILKIYDARAYQKKKEQYGEMLFRYGTQVRTTGSDTAIITHDFLVSPWPLGLDIAYQRFEGGLTGEGFGLRLPLFTTPRRFDDPDPFAGRLSSRYVSPPTSPIRWDDHVSIRRRLEDTQGQFQSDTNNLAALKPESLGTPRGDRVIQEARDALSQFIVKRYEPLRKAITQQKHAYRAEISGWKGALIGGIRSLDFGSISNFGASISALVPIGTFNEFRTPPALLFILSLQDVHIRLKPPGDSASAGSFGFALAYQDRIPNREYDAEGKFLREHYWRHQTGLEVNLKNINLLNNGTSYTLFTRWRPAKAVEIGLFASLKENDKASYGLRLSFNFLSKDPRPKTPGNGY